MNDVIEFPLPFGSFRALRPPALRTLREVEMMRLSAEIRAKPRWFEKMDDAEIAGRWSREAAEQGLTAAQIAYVLAELRHYAALRDASTGLEVTAVDGVWQSDDLIGAELTDRLRAAVRVLEQVPEAELDWHPGSDGQVLDLVHPSLFCLVRGVSPIDEAVWANPGTKQSPVPFSERFQWLPTDVDVDADGAVTFASYVNNVHPERHGELEAVLPELLARMLPLFEAVLTDLLHPAPIRIVPDSSAWYEGEPEEPDLDIEDDDAYDAAEEAYEAAWDDWYRDRRPTIPDAPVYVPPALPSAGERFSLRDRRIQVIVKLATIHLTPGKPDYPGGSWHVEGMLNERIVSTAIYYWDSENITESTLGFRTAVSDPYYEQNDDMGMREVYGLEDQDALNQFLGSVPTGSGRCLAFPNVLQHRVAPFSLADPTRPGHRKILAFFLVDPTRRVPSTTDVPPQQPWSPTTTMTLAEAKSHREALMKERKYAVDAHTGYLYEREFSLCEH
ncbi:DUF4246 domain-containing protein [Nocardia sp. NPDC003693]